MPIPKLHELLAAESNIETQTDKVRSELANTFEKKRHLFEEKQSVFTPLAEGAKAETKVDCSLQTTVADQLTEIAPYLAKWLDSGIQVAEANTRAKADIIDDDGTVLAKDIPATALLEMEKRAVAIQQMLAAIPTLDPAKGFTQDTQRGANVYKAREIAKPRTKKEAKVIVKYPHTPEHPAQTELINVDEVIGTVLEQEWSGMYTPAQKTALMNRAELFVRAIRRARSRANDVEINASLKIGAGLVKYVFG